MPTIEFNRANPNGIDILSSAVFDGLEEWSVLTKTSTQFRLQDQDTVTFTGTGLTYSYTEGELTGVSGGTVNSIVDVNNGTNFVSWTGLNVSAAAMFTYVISDNWSALNTLLFTTGDTYKMTDAADNVRGFGGNDVVYGYGGNDMLTGDAGNDKLFGGLGKDKLLGGAGADKLDGGSGADTLIGGAGIDTLTGGTGADAFVFATAGATNRDIITDFRAVDDALRFDNDVFSAFSYTGQLRSSGFVAGTAAVDTSDRFIYQKSTGNLWYDRDGSGSAAKVLVAELVDGTTLTAADIFIL